MRIASIIQEIVATVHDFPHDCLLICSKTKYGLPSASMHCLCITQPQTPYSQSPFTIKVLSSKQVTNVPPRDGNSIATEPAYYDTAADIEPDSLFRNLTWCLLVPERSSSRVLV